VPPAAFDTLINGSRECAKYLLIGKLSIYRFLPRSYTGANLFLSSSAPALSPSDAKQLLVRDALRELKVYMTIRADDRLQ